MPPPPADPIARLDWAFAGPQRSEYRDRFGAAHSNRSRDASRHPKEMLTFFGLEPKMTVVELWPGGGWFTEILAPFLRDQGKLVVTSDDLATASAASKRWALQYEDKLLKEPSVYGKVEIRPKDDHHHEGGVWDLPPDFPKNEADRGKYVGVGESDRMTLKFRKP